MTAQKGKGQFACDADLGDQRCTIDLDLAAFKGTGAVTAAADQRTLTVSSAPSTKTGSPAG